MVSENLTILFTAWLLKAFNILMTLLMENTVFSVSITWSTEPFPSSVLRFFFFFFSWNTPWEMPLWSNKLTCNTGDSQVFCGWWWLFSWSSYIEQCTVFRSGFQGSVLLQSVGVKKKKDMTCTQMSSTQCLSSSGMTHLLKWKVVFIVLIMSDAEAKIPGFLKIASPVSPPPLLKINFHWPSFHAPLEVLQE